MKRFINFGPLARAVAIVAAVGILATGVTFAALQSQNATLQGSTITSATANLQIGLTPTTFGASAAGFSFANVEPGGAAVPASGNDVYLKNAGTSPLNLRLAMNTSTYTNQNANLDKVFLILTPLSGSGTTQTIALSSLLTAYSGSTAVPLNLSLPAGSVGEYQLQIQMSSDVVSSPTNVASLDGVDLIFSGTTAAN